MNATLSYRLRTAARLKWRLTRNFLRRRPVEAVAIMLVALTAMVVLLVLLLASSAGLLMQAWSLRLAASVWFWSLFVLLGLLIPPVAAIALTRLLSFPLRSGHLFGMALLDQVTSPHALILLWLALPLAAVFADRALGFLAFLLAFCLFACFIICWLRLLLALSQHFAAFRILRVAAAVSLLLLGWVLVALIECVQRLAPEEPGGHLLVEAFQRHWPAIQRCWAAAAGVLHYAPPGMAAESYLSAVRGDYALFLAGTSILAGETGLCLWLAYVLTTRLYRRDLSSSESAPQHWQRKAWERFLSRKRSVSVAGLLRFADSGFRQLVRKEWLYMRRVTSGLVFIIPALVPWLLVLATVYPGNLPDEEVLLLVLFLIVLFIAYFSVEPLSMKFGWDGFAIEALLVTPISRSKILGAKSFALALPLLLFHWAILLVFSLSVHLSVRYAVVGLTLLLGVVLLADASGNLLAVLYPLGMAVAKVRWRLRATERLGCLALLLRQLLALALSLLVLPVAVIMLVALLLKSWLALAVAAALALGYTAASYYLLFRCSVRLFELHEKEIIRRLTTEFK